MDKRSLVLYLSGLAAAGAVVGLAASCSDQPKMKCTAGHGVFAAVYTEVSGDKGCAPPGEQIGIEAYNNPLPDNTNLDPNSGRLGMEPLIIGDRGPDPDKPKEQQSSLGNWVTPEPGSDNFCYVADPNDIDQTLPAIPAVPPSDGGAGSPFVPSLSLKYHWSKVHFYNTPAAPGTQLVAELTYTAQRGPSSPDGGAPEPPCTAQIHVVGLWPAVSCEDDTDPTKTDVTKCSPEPDNTKNRPTGSGIGPDLLTKCDENLHLCVLAKEPPSFK